MSVHERVTKRGATEYVWNIKYHGGWESDEEKETALRWAFGEWTRGQFSEINDLLGRPVKAGTDGRSGGYLVIYDSLTAEEVAKVTAHVDVAMAALPEFLEEERALAREEQQCADREYEEKRTALQADERVQKVLAQLCEVAGCDFVLVIKGVKFDHVD